jgi:hypothetical protein
MGALGGVIYQVANNGRVLFDDPTSGIQESASPDQCLPCLRLIESFEQTQPKEVVMNEVIAGLYEKTADAVVVNKWFGKWLNRVGPDDAASPALNLLFKLHHKDFLAEALRLDAEEKAKAEKK